MRLSSIFPLLLSRYASKYLARLRTASRECCEVGVQRENGPSREQLAQMLKAPRRIRSNSQNKPIRAYSRYSPRAPRLIQILTHLSKKQNKNFPEPRLFLDINQAASSRPFSLRQSLVPGASKVLFLLSP